MQNKIKNQLSSLVETMRPHLLSESKLNVWIGNVANFWGAVSIFAIVFTAVVIFFFFRDEPPAIIEPLIFAAFAIVAIVFFILRSIILNAKSSREQLRDEIRELDPGLQIAIEVLLKNAPERKWAWKELLGESKNRGSHLTPSNMRDLIQKKFVVNESTRINGETNMIGLYSKWMGEIRTLWYQFRKPIDFEHTHIIKLHPRLRDDIVYLVEECFPNGEQE